MRRINWIKTPLHPPSPNRVLSPRNKKLIYLGNSNKQLWMHFVKVFILLKFKIKKNIFRFYYRSNWLCNYSLALHTKVLNMYVWKKQAAIFSDDYFYFFFWHFFFYYFRLTHELYLKYRGVCLYKLQVQEYMKI